MAVQESNLIGKRFRFESKNYPNHFIRHFCWKLYKHEYDSKVIYQLDSSFDVIPGVAGQGVSLRSVNYPAYFIGHRRGDCLIRSSDGKQTFKEDVSWIPRPGLADPAGISFESVNYPGHYLRHHNNKQLRRDANDASVVFKEESTWYPRLISDADNSVSFCASLYANLSPWALFVRTYNIRKPAIWQIQCTVKPLITDSPKGRQPPYSGQIPCPRLLFP